MSTETKQLVSSLKAHPVLRRTFLAIISLFTAIGIFSTTRVIYEIVSAHLFWR